MQNDPEENHMGFGMLFAGYATLLLFRVIPIELVGFFIIYLALEKLEKKCARFRYAKYASVFLFVEAIPASVSWLCTFLKLPVPFFESSLFSTAESILYHGGLLVFHILVMLAVAEISESVGYTKGKNRARFSVIGTCIFYIAELAATFIPGASAYMSLPLAAFQMLWLLFNLFTFYCCYMMIVTDEMLEAEEKKYTEYLAKHAPKNTKAPKALPKKDSGTKKFKASKK